MTVVPLTVTNVDGLPEVNKTKEDLKTNKVPSARSINRFNSKEIPTGYRRGVVTRTNSTASNTRRS